MQRSFTGREKQLFASLIFQQQCLFNYASNLEPIPQLDLDSDQYNNYTESGQVPNKNTASVYIAESKELPGILGLFAGKSFNER